MLMALCLDNLLSSKHGIYLSKNVLSPGKEKMIETYYSIENGGISSAPMHRRSIHKPLMSGNINFRFNHKTITPIQLNNQLDNDSFEGIIVDLRERRQYQRSHIKNAVLGNCSTKLMSKKTIVDWKKFDMFDKEHYLLYDQQSNLPAPNSPQMIFIEFLITNNKQISYLQGGFDEFKKICKESFIETDLSKEKSQSYSFCSTNIYVNSEDILNATASCILPFMFIGNERDSSDLELLNDFGITHILNMTKTSPFYFQNLNRFQYRRLPACDNHMQNLSVLYNDAFSFIDEARYSEGKILIHCWAGVSRSPTIVIAYLLKHSHLSVLGILKFLQSKRNIVAPNIHFVGQLEKYYHELNKDLEKRCVDLQIEDL